MFYNEEPQQPEGRARISVEKELYGSSVILQVLKRQGNEHEARKNGETDAFRREYKRL